MNAKTISIGGASGYWGEAIHATAQLLTAPYLDYLVYDYLAEITMSIMARARAKDPDSGFATDFVSGAMAPNLEKIAQRGIKVISNAGGVNPMACAGALRALIAEKSLSLKVAVVTGDDLSVRAVDFTDRTEMFSKEPFPDPNSIASINAYLGAFPIAAALDAGADIVITGRCVDSAVTLGACIHEFGWEPDDFDLLSAGSLAGHLIECGPQATGGNFTDWRDVGDIARIGYPIAEISADGTCIITKPEETTGLVSPLTVGEQMLYEIGDPRAYLLPDVSCDFSEVTLEQETENRVLVRGAKGKSPTSFYKVSATHMAGFRAGQIFAFNGYQSRAKAQAFATAILDRTRERLRGLNAGDFDESSVEVLGGEDDGYGEVMLKIAVRHQDARAIGIFLKEMAGIGLATPAGMSAFTGGGRPRPSPVIRLFSFLIDKEQVSVSLSMTDRDTKILELENTGAETALVEAPVPDSADLSGNLKDVPLIALAVARSGDKGDKANIGVIAREPRYLPYIWNALIEQKVAERFADYLEGGVVRFYLPGSHAINLVLDRALGGGGIASLRQDAQAKGYGQLLLAMPIAVPADWAEEIDLEKYV